MSLRHLRSGVNAEFWEEQLEWQRQFHFLKIHPPVKVQLCGKPCGMWIKCSYSSLRCPPIPLNQSPCFFLWLLTLFSPSPMAFHLLLKDLIGCDHFLWDLHQEVMGRRSECLPIKRKQSCASWTHFAGVVFLCQFLFFFPPSLFTAYDFAPIPCLSFFLRF